MSGDTFDVYDDWIRAAAACPMCQRWIALDLVDRRLVTHPLTPIGPDCPGSRLKPAPSGRRPDA
jgi:hypothetical protein